MKLTITLTPEKGGRWVARCRALHAQHAGATAEDALRRLSLTVALYSQEELETAGGSKRRRARAAVAATAARRVKRTKRKKGGKR